MIDVSHITKGSIRIFDSNGKLNSYFGLPAIVWYNHSKIIKYDFFDHGEKYESPSEMINFDLSVLDNVRDNGSIQILDENDKLHSFHYEQPAIIWFNDDDNNNRSHSFYNHGVCERKDNYAIYRQHADKEQSWAKLWMQKGYRHNLNGPAVMHSDGSRSKVQVYIHILLI